MKKKSLAIIQSHPTQFDTSLFRTLHKNEKFNFCAYFTNAQNKENSYDPEINRRSGWDMDIISGYDSVFFSKNLLKKILTIFSIIKKSDLIIISGYSSFLYIIIALFSKFSSVKTGLRADSVFLYRKENFKWKIKDIILPIIFKLYDFGFPTGSLAKELMLKYKFQNKNLFYFPYAIDHDFLEKNFNKHNKQRNKLRNNIKINKDDFVVLGIMKFVDREDPMTLLKAFNKVSENNKNFHLILVGDGILKNNIIEYQKTNSVLNVHLPGYVSYSELTKFYSIADVFVHTAVIEQWGVSVNESMTCLTPVIAADTVGSVYDLIDEEETGLVFKSTDHIDLSSQILKLYYSPKLQKKIISNAEKKIRNWSYNLTVNEIEKCLNN